MNTLSKIILVFFGIALLGILILYTFSENNIEKLKSSQLSIIPDGTILQISSAPENTYETLEVSSISQTGAHVQYLGLNNRVFSNSDLKLTRKNITVPAGLHLFDINDNNQISSVSGTGFLVNIEGSGMFLINNTNPKFTVVYSINANLALGLYEKSQQDFSENIIHTAYLYPHLYVRFNSTKGQNLNKNSDSLRAAQVLGLKYYPYPLIENKQVNQTTTKFFSIRKQESQDLLNTYLGFIQYSYKDDREDFISNSKIISYNIPGQESIQRYYSHFFLNEEKKKIFLENMILRNTKKVLVSKSNKDEIIEQIKKYYSELQGLGNNSEKFIDNLIEYYFQKIYFTEHNNTHLHHNISKLYNVVTGINHKIPNNQISLKNSYYKYDLLGKNNTYKDVYDYNTKASSNKNDNQKDYFLFFIENLLSLNLDNIEDQYPIFISLFNQITQDSVTYYNTPEFKKAGLHNQIKILENIGSITRKVFFDDKRDKNGLLVRSYSKNAQDINIRNLEASVNKILEFYNKNKSLINDPNGKNIDISTNEKYTELTKNFDEFFLALTNSDEYAIRYDKWKKGILDESSLGEKDDSKILTEEKIKKYMNQFQGKTSNSYTVYLRSRDYCFRPIEKYKNTSKDYYCYEIEKINFYGTELSFLIYPHEQNKIDHIKKWENNQYKEINGSYKLNDLELELDEKYKSISEVSEKYLYDFNNFFLLNFTGYKQGNSNGSSTPIIDDPKKNTETEDAFVRVLKSSKLLGSKGDFNTIKSFFTINYDDLIVKRNLDNDSYKITLNGGKISKNSIINRKNTLFLIDVYGEYIFTPSHSFLDLSLTFLNDPSRTNPSQKLQGVPVLIKGETHINQFESIIDKILSMYSSLEELLNSLALNGANIIEIEYISDDQSISIQASHDSKAIDVKLKDGKIIYYKHNNTTIKDSNTPRNGIINFEVDINLFKTILTNQINNEKK